MVLMEKGEHQTVIKLHNLKWAIEKYLESTNSKISSSITYILMELLLNKQSRYRIFSNKTCRMLVHLLSKSKRVRERTLDLLRALYSDTDMHLEDLELINELVRLYSSENG